MNKVINKKVLLSIIIINICNLYAQVRDFVGVVRADIDPQVVSFLKDFQNELNAKGFSSYSHEIDSYLAGSFGSGFIYVDSNGNNYVITNRHVIGESKKASLEFENPDTGAITKYENLRVTAFNDEIDVAVLSFENGAKPFKKGLAFSNEKVTDGMEVFSAGFPGLGGKPLWQFGRGTVTNASARIKELLDPDISVLIQHSAEVDAGNSGGPLLIASENGEYKIAGINTWKAVYRQNTNFAIPAKVVADFIANGKSPTEEERSEKIEAILKNTDSEYTEIAKYISLETVCEQGSAAFIDILRRAPTSVRNTVVSAFEQSPLEGAKYAIAYDLKNEITPKKDKTQDYSSKKNSEIVKFMGIDSPSICDFYAGPVFGFGEAELGFGITGGLAIMPYTICGLEISANHYFADSISVINFGPDIRLPLNFNKFFIIPFAKAAAGLSFQGDTKYTNVKLEGGAEVLFNKSDLWKWGLGFSYSYMKFKKFGNATIDSRINEESVSNVCIYGKVSF